MSYRSWLAWTRCNARSWRVQSMKTPVRPFNCTRGAGDWRAQWLCISSGRAQARAGCRARTGSFSVCCRPHHASRLIALAESGTLCASSASCPLGISPMVASAASLLLSVPIPRTRLIGRETELAAAQALILDEAVPLLTLTGPGGVGKTRLALAIVSNVTHHFDDGAVFVDLAPLSDPSLVLPTVARTLGVGEGGDLLLSERLIAALHRRCLLLVLDNCEHVLTAVAD